MKSATDVYTLRNGVKIPCIGLGTWQMNEGTATVTAVVEALSRGYRHIDTAAGYGNEASVGRAVKKSGLPREEIFITSKLQNTVRGYRDTLAAFERTMENLDTPYLDLYLIHWPNPVAYRGSWQEANAESWTAFEELYAAGRIRAVGISNFRERHIEALMKTAKVAPMVNQIRLCPGDTQDELVAYCRKGGMLLEAYSPLGTGKIFSVPELQNLGRKYGKTVARICIRWSLQMGFLPLPKSGSAERIAENAAVFDFELEETDVRTIADLKGCCGYSADPDTTMF